MCRRVKPLPCGREFTRERGDCRAMASILIQGSESEEERIPATLERFPNENLYIKRRIQPHDTSL